MMIVMKATATEEDVRSVAERIESVGARADVSEGAEITVIGAIGDRDHDLRAPTWVSRPTRASTM